MDELCLHMMQGGTVAEFCRIDGNPGRVTIYEWVNTDKAFAERFARARDFGFDAIADECKQIADSGEDVNGDHVKRSALRIDTRLKLLAKWSPRYRDTQKIEAEITDTASAILAARRRTAKKGGDGK